LITAKPKRNIVRLIITITILAAILGGITTVVLFETRSAASSGPDFSIKLQKGSIENPEGTNLGSTETILNGTIGLNNSGEKIIVTVNRNGTFSSFVRLNITGLPPGITYSLIPLVVRPTSGAPVSSTLTLTAASNVVVQPAPYNVTVTGTSASPAIVHKASFHLLVRNTKMFLSPSVQTVLKGQSVTVGVNLSGAYNITGFQFTIKYNATLLTGLTSGLAFNPDFTTPGVALIVPSNPAAGCPWVDNSTGTIGPCGISAVFLFKCATSQICITVTGNQFYNLVNVTFVAKMSGTATLTLTSDVITEAEGANISTPPHHTLGGIVTIGEVYYPRASVSDIRLESMLWLLGVVVFAPVLPLVFYHRLRRVRTLVRASDAPRRPRYDV
jgi:hypothetical protein